MLGGAVGGVAHMLLPDYTGSVGAYALVGMGTAFAGIVRVPLTSVIMIFEITRDYSIIVPLMISNLISYFISSRLQQEPIYEALQHQDGISLPPGARDREEVLRVRDGMHPAVEVLPAGDMIAEAVARVHRERESWPVVAGDGLRGILSIHQLDEAIDDGRGWQLVGDLVAPLDSPVHLSADNFPHVHADHPLDTAMRRMAQTGLTTLPVVSRANVRQLEGVISLHDIMATYGLEKSQARVAEAAREEMKAPRGSLGGMVAAAVIALVLIGVLSYVYRVERTARAAQYFKNGNQFLARERYEDAIEQYRNALSISHSAEQRLALAEALRKADRLDEAELYFREVLRQNPASGPAHLGLARIAAAERICRKQWRSIMPSRSMALDAAKPLQARFELIDTLGRFGRTRRPRSSCSRWHSRCRPTLRRACVWAGCCSSSACRKNRPRCFGPRWQIEIRMRMPMRVWARPTWRWATCWTRARRSARGCASIPRAIRTGSACS